jgi:hypothetical protein
MLGFIRTQWSARRSGGGRLSRDAIERLITKYINVAKQSCPSRKRKKSLHMFFDTPRLWTFFNMVSIAS